MKIRQRLSILREVLLLFKISFFFCDGITGMITPVFPILDPSYVISQYYDVPGLNYFGYKI